MQVWNGISNTGAENIENFLSQLPHSTHNVLSLDMQRLPGKKKINTYLYLKSTASDVKIHVFHKFVFSDYILKYFFFSDNTPDKRTFLIKTAGTVKFKDYINKQFFQTFFTTSVGGKYNISIDNYRCLDGTP